MKIIQIKVCISESIESIDDGGLISFQVIRDLVSDLGSEVTMEDLAKSEPTCKAMMYDAAHFLQQQAIKYVKEKDKGLA